MAWTVNDTQLPLRVSGFPRRIAALRTDDEEQTRKLGAFTQLDCSTGLVVCGAGYNERTVLVQSNNQMFFVFRDDLI